MAGDSKLDALSTLCTVEGSARAEQEWVEQLPCSVCLSNVYVPGKPPIILPSLECKRGRRACTRCVENNDDCSNVEPALIDSAKKLCYAFDDYMECLNGNEQGSEDLRRHVEALADCQQEFSNEKASYTESNTPTQPILHGRRPRKTSRKNPKQVKNTNTNSTNRKGKTAVSSRPSVRNESLFLENAPSSVEVINLEEGDGSQEQYLQTLQADHLKTQELYSKFGIPLSPLATQEQSAGTLAFSSPDNSLGPPDPPVDKPVALATLAPSVPANVPEKPSNTPDPPSSSGHVSLVQPSRSRDNSSELTPEQYAYLSQPLDSEIQPPSPGATKFEFLCYYLTENIRTQNRLRQDLESRLAKIERQGAHRATALEALGQQLSEQNTVLTTQTSIQKTMAGYLSSLVEQGNRVTPDSIPERRTATFQTTIIPAKRGTDKIDELPSTSGKKKYVRVSSRFDGLPARTPTPK